jgi:hypothetical protein
MPGLAFDDSDIALPLASCCLGLPASCPVQPEAFFGRWKRATAPPPRAQRRARPPDLAVKRIISMPRRNRGDNLAWRSTHCRRDARNERSEAGTMDQAATAETAAKAPKTPDSGPAPLWHWLTDRLSDIADSASAARAPVFVAVAFWLAMLVPEQTDEAIRALLDPGPSQHGTHPFWLVTSWLILCGLLGLAMLLGGPLRLRAD